MVETRVDVPSVVEQETVFVESSRRSGYFGPGGVDLEPLYKSCSTLFPRSPSSLRESLPSSVSPTGLDERVRVGKESKDDTGLGYSILVKFQPYIGNHPYLKKINS